MSIAKLPQQSSDEQLASLIENNMGLIVKLAKSFSPKSEDELQEYIQLGRIAIWKASKKHDESRSKFSTTAWKYIRWEILRYLSRKKHTEFQLEDFFDVPNTSIGPGVWESLPNYLTQREFDVLELKLKGYNFIEIGKQMGFSRGWANNIFKSAIKKIQHANKEKTNINM